MPDSGPQNRQSLTDEEIFSVIDGSIDAYGKEWVLALSGGEPFLYLDRLQRIVEYRNTEKARTTVVTNGFWATTEDRAAKVLKPLIEAGLTTISFSISRYHFEYVHPERVENGILAARKLGLQAIVKAVEAKDSTLPFVLGAIRRVKPWEDLPIQVIDVIPEGRAASPGHVETNGMVNIPQEKCPAEILTIKPNGNASPCCNGAGETDVIDIGNVKTDTIIAIQERLKTNPTMVDIRDEGPAALLSKLPPAVQKEMQASEWVNVCHLCCEVLKHLPEGTEGTRSCQKAMV